MIKIKPKVRPKKPSKPYYNLAFQYMIGDADGNHTEDVKIDIDNPHLEKFVTIVKKLKPTKGYWAFQLDDEDIEKSLKAKQISKEEFEFLKETLHGETEEDDKYIFSEGVITEGDIGRYFFQGAFLTYIDEWGEEHQTEIV